VCVCVCVVLLVTGYRFHKAAPCLLIIQRAHSIKVEHIAAVVYGYMRVHGDKQ